MKKLTIRMTKLEVIFGWCYTAFQLLILGGILVTGNAMLGEPLNMAQLDFLYFLTNCLFTWLIFARYLTASAKHALRTPWRCLKAACMGFGLYWVINFALVCVILVLQPGFSNVNNDSITATAQDNYLLMSIGTVILVPVTEEVLFRGLIFRGLFNRSRIFAYIVSILAFALPHVIGYIGQYDALRLILCFLQYIPAGLCLGLAYEKADSIWAPILMHTAINLISMIALR